MSRGASLIQIFGIEKTELEFGGGELPQSAQGAKKAAERAQQQVIEGKEFREGTKISRRAEQEINQTVKLVRRAVEQREINSLDDLRACIEQLLDRLDEEMAGE